MFSFGIIAVLSSSTVKRVKMEWLGVEFVLLCKAMGEAGQALVGPGEYECVRRQTVGWREESSPVFPCYPDFSSRRLKQPPPPYSGACGCSSLWMSLPVSFKLQTQMKSYQSLGRWEGSTALSHYHG